MANEKIRIPAKHVEPPIRDNAYLARPGILTTDVANVKWGLLKDKATLRFKYTYDVPNPETGASYMWFERLRVSKWHGLRSYMKVGLVDSVGPDGKHTLHIVVTPPNTEQDAV